MKKHHYLRLIGLILLLSLVGISILALNNFHTNYQTQKEKSGNPGDTIRVINLNKIAYNKRLSNPQITIEKADSALNLAKSINYIPGIAEAHRVIGVGYSYLENPTLSVESYMESLKHFKKLGDIRNEARIYNNIGNLYRFRDYNTALSYYKKALSLSENLSNNELRAGLYFSIASVYQNKGQYNKSLDYYNKSNQIFTRLKDTTYLIMYLQNTGIVYYLKDRLETAESRLIEAVKKAKKHGLPRIITGSYLVLSCIYLKKNDFIHAETHINKGIQYSKELNDAHLEFDFIYKAYELETKRKNYPKALGYLNKIYKRDSLLLAQNQTKNIGITSEHYLQRQKLQENQLIIARQKYNETLYWWIITIIISFLLLAIILGLLRHFWIQKKRRIKELHIQNKIALLEQKALQAMMNPHFLFNIMSSIQYLMQMKDNIYANEILSGFAKLMRKHLEICRNSTVSIDEEVEYLRLYLSLEKIRYKGKMDYNITIKKPLDGYEVTIPSMMIQPFIENAIWHGIMPNDGEGLIEITIRKENNNVYISITDNGIGITNSQKSKISTHLSRGLDLIHERVNLLNKLNKEQIQILQHQTGDFGTEVLISISQN